MSNILKYPLQRIESISDYLKISVVEYQAPGLGSSAGAAGIFQLPQGSQVNVPGSKDRILGTIFLPIPEGLNDLNRANWAGSELNSLAGAAINSLTDVGKTLSLDNLQSDLGGTLKNAGETLAGAAGKALAGLDGKTRSTIAGAFVGSAVNLFGSNVSLNDLTARTEGVILNPNLELLFKGVDLRNFTFAFEFTPRSRAESEQVKAIIKTFKRRMAPKTSITNSSGGSAGIFIQSPDVFNLEFRTGGRKHPFLFSMKTCALTNIQVDYAGTGAYTTYEDSTPGKMRMALSFRELNPIYAEDYNDNSADGVGF